MQLQPAQQKVRHFLKLSDLGPAELRGLIARAIELKANRHSAHKPLAGRTLAMIFAKASTRTRVSFEVAMAQLGGHALFLSPRDIQLGRGEPLADTARVISSMCDGIMIRNDSQAEQEQVARYSRVPVINGLSELHHPCQLLADLQTFTEQRGDIARKTVAWLGDGNNVCNSWVEAARLMGFTLRIGCPEGFDPDPKLVAQAAPHVEIQRDPRFAVENADLVVTDVWTSMGQEEEKERRHAALGPYQVNAGLMQMARRDALFMHCLPAHRGEEVAADVIDGRQSAVWQEAENRLHAQKALLELLMQPAGGAAGPAGTASTIGAWKSSSRLA
ncbi:MAG TPA: ornithine carbamoyltransferase [Candidatus Binatia bacterium]|nr:ornithine carbamoyltransferase [Candidatus Binatia bacterium]